MERTIDDLDRSERCVTLACARQSVRSAQHYPNDLIDAKWPMLASMLPSGKRDGRRAMSTSAKSSFSAKSTPHDCFHRGEIAASGARQHGGLKRDAAWQKMGNCHLLPDWQQRYGAGYRRHSDAEEGRSFGWCRFTVCLNPFGTTIPFCAERASLQIALSHPA